MFSLKPKACKLHVANQPLCIQFKHVDSLFQNAQQKIRKHGLLIKVAISFCLWCFQVCSLCFVLSANKNDKTENKTGEPKKPKTTGITLRERRKTA